jgi:quercetin 2,3-dioxygenase
MVQSCHLQMPSINPLFMIRRAEERGHADHGWLNTYHSFSFADYYDPAHMGFRALRVINEDRVKPGRGFGTHPHRDMEIISYVLSGGLEHRDSMGNGSVIRPGEVQRMSAGTGVTHSEFNASGEELVHFLQIWLLPTERGIRPGYEQKFFERTELGGRLRLVASPDGRDGSVTVHADANLYAGLFDAGATGELALREGRHAWAQIARGKARINGHELGAGDGAAMSDVAGVTIEGVDACEVLVFDLG